MRAIKSGKTVYLSPEAPSFCECAFQEDGDLCEVCKAELYTGKTLTGLMWEDMDFRTGERFIRVDLE